MTFTLSLFASQHLSHVLSMLIVCRARLLICNYQAILVSPTLLLAAYSDSHSNLLLTHDLPISMQMALLDLL